MTQPPAGEQPAEVPPVGSGPPVGHGPPIGYGPPPGYGQPPQYGYPPAVPGYGYPPPGYAYGYRPAGPPQDKPSSNIGWAIAALFAFWPLAIPAFIFSSKVDNAWNMGDRAGAENASHSAKQFGLVAVIIGVVLLVLLIIWFIVIFAFVTDTVRNIPTVTFQPQPS